MMVEKILSQDAPLVAGGQGRSAEEVTDTGMTLIGLAWVVCCVAAGVAAVLLTGCNRPLATEELAIVATVAVGSKERAASFDAIRQHLRAAADEDKNTVALCILRHSNGLNTQALLMSDIQLAIQSGEVLTETLKTQIATEAELSLKRADNWREASKLMARTEDNVAWFAAHQEALDHHAMLLMTAVERLKK